MEFALKSFLLHMFLVVLLSTAPLFAEDRGAIQFAPLYGDGIRIDVVTGEKSTWGGSYAAMRTGFEGQKPGGIVLEISRTDYVDTLFEGLYSRYGVLYSSFSVMEESLSLAEVRFVAPFISIGMGRVIDSVVFHYGVGLGYNLIDVTSSAGGTEFDASDYSGLGLTLDLSFGVKF